MEIVKILFCVLGVFIFAYIYLAEKAIRSKAQPIKSSDLFEKDLFKDVIRESKKLIKDLDSIEERIGKISNPKICKRSFLSNSKPVNDVPTNPFPSLVVYEPPKEIKKVSTILMQCERWVNTNEHEMASIYYEIIANECKKLSEEHKRSI